MKQEVLNKHKTLIRTHLSSISSILTKLEKEKVFEYPNTSGSKIVDIKKALLDIELSIKRLE